MKKLVVFFLICLLLALTAGCGSDADYPVMEDIELPSDLQECTDGNYTAQYDQNVWVYDDSLGFAIYNKEIYESGNPDGNCDNINVVVSQAYEGSLTEDDMNEIISQVESMGISGFVINMNEMRTFLDQPVIYYESSVRLTDDMIDLLIEQGSLTEEDVEAYGGRETLIESAATNQITVCAVVDGYIVIVTGTYYSDENKEMVLDGIKTLIKTGSVQE